MENQYKKTFPNLMVGKKIIYVHGFMSAGSTHTAQILRDYMPQATVIAPDLPIHPEEAMELLRNLVKTENPDLIIGTSMGGMYTEMLYGVDRICVNPAFQMGSTITESNMMGKQVYQNERQDGEKEVIVTKALVKEYKEMTEQCFAQVTEEEQLKVFGLFGDEDPIVHTFDLFSEHYTQAIHFHGEHRLIEKAIFHYLMPVIRWIDDRQEGRERRTVLRIPLRPIMLRIRDCHPLRLNFPEHSPHTQGTTAWSYNPRRALKRSGFGLLPVRSPLLGESLTYFLFLQVLRCFSSLR